MSEFIKIIIERRTASAFLLLIRKLAEFDLVNNNLMLNDKDKVHKKNFASVADTEWFDFRSETLHIIAGQNANDYLCRSSNELSNSKHSYSLSNEFFLNSHNKIGEGN